MIVSPITSVHKPEVKTLIAIPAGYKVQGSIIAEQVRALDLSQRWWRSTGEILPAEVLEKAIAILQVIVA